MTPCLPIKKTLFLYLLSRPSFAFPRRLGLCNSSRVSYMFAGQVVAWLVSRACVCVGGVIIPPVS